MKGAAQDLYRLGPKYVLITNDQLFIDISQKAQSNDSNNTDLVAVLFDGSNFTVFKNSYVPTTREHDIRSTLSAAITAYLAHGMDMIVAIEHAIAYTHSSTPNSLGVDRNNDLPVDKICSESLDQSDKSPLQSTNRVIIVNQQILLQKRSFVQLLKNSCFQEWVCMLLFWSRA